MDLWIEEYLGVADVLAVGALEVGECEGFKVVRGDERGHADEVVMQEVI